VAPARCDVRNAGRRRLHERAPSRQPDAVLSRTDLRELGYERRAIDAIFRACPVVALPGYGRPLIRVSDYLNLILKHTYNGRDRVR
jgi:hypothetical protein